MCFLHGVRSRTGLMGIGYPTAAWLYNYAEIVPIRRTQSTLWMISTILLHQCTLEQLTWDGCRNMKEAFTRSNGWIFWSKRPDQVDELPQATYLMKCIHV
ncbi:hypothetical protein BRADI_3g60592v3 [Brachypodium distachyon]|nr:hypothetical protein BRADI_3g60592v3 [Brachypodium distachyon]KQK02143.1 hypothetical protein BRADI_3g60592v3 [Brachypodium distachyon]KQK02144.1 hypothetical protein BRADI_3g60592v3 [Brachypodium distachyon]KQK02145.1 hypothetical protein BRADI_3g60592v3 [Brachypodium distachyon]PNT69738.1 hypothetical protein BRADI_3g60592v3 [Brachypodium distachyon]